MFGPLVEREIQCFACFAQGATPLHPLFGLSHTSHEEMQRQFHRNVWGTHLARKPKTFDSWAFIDNPSRFPGSVSTCLATAI